MLDLDHTPGNPAELSVARTLLYYCLQLILCYPATMLAVLPVAALLRAFGLSGDLPSQIHFAGYQALLCLFIGPIVGWTAGRLVPSLVSTGRWLWVLPAAVLIFSIVAAKNQPVPWLPEEFFASSDNEGIGVYFLTLPSCAALGYSIGMVLRGAYRKRASGPGLHPVVRILLVAVIGALFVPSAALMHRFERVKMESWSKVRFVIDPSGLRFSPDPNLLCAATSAALPLLRAHLESLESRTCSGGRLLDNGATPPRDSFVIEKVRVLDGTDTGRVGWVPSYGLLETVRSQREIARQVR